MVNYARVPPATSAPGTICFSPNSWQSSRLAQSRCPRTRLRQRMYYEYQHVPGEVRDERRNPGLAIQSLCC